MSRKVRIQYPGAVHHVMNRGERREAIGEDGQDRQPLLRALTRASKKIGWRVFVLLAAQVVLFGGCTSALWDKETFAHHYRPADPVNLHLFYSQERRDVLVQYDESKKEKLEAYRMPTYVGGSQTVKQVLLTPFAVAVDATIVGAVIGYYSAPGIFASLSR